MHACFLNVSQFEGTHLRRLSVTLSRCRPATKMLNCMNSCSSPAEMAAALIRVIHRMRICFRFLILIQYLWNDRRATQAGWLARSGHPHRNYHSDMGHRWLSSFMTLTDASLKHLLERPYIPQTREPPKSRTWHNAIPTSTAPHVCDKEPFATAKTISRGIRPSLAALATRQTVPSRWTSQLSVVSLPENMADNNIENTAEFIQVVPMWVLHVSPSQVLVHAGGQQCFLGLSAFSITLGLDPDQLRRLRFRLALISSDTRTNHTSTRSFR